MIRHFLFDLGNVLYAFDFERFHRGVERLGGRVTEESRRDHLAMRDDYESGRLDDDAFTAASLRLFGLGPGADADFRRAWRDIFEPNDPMVGFLRDLHGTGEVSLHLLSNTNGMHLEHIDATWGLLRWFHGGVFSHRAGCMKPERRIFDIAARDCAIDPAATLFIDDRSDNTASAEAAGFLVHTYDARRHGEFLSRLGELGHDPGAGSAQTV